MQMLKSIPILILLLAGAAQGQTTRPSTRPTLMMSVAEMREEILALRAEVRKLMDENRRLRGTSVSEAKAEPDDDKIQLALARHEPEVGMTIEQWTSQRREGRFLGAQADKLGTTRDGDEWLFSYLLETLPGQTSSGRVRFNVVMQDGKVTAWKYASRRK